MHQTNFYFEHQDIIILAYKKTIKIAQATFNIWISIVFMIFFVNYVDSLPRVTYLFFFFWGGGGGLEPGNDVPLTFKGVITHTSQCMVFSSRRPCFGRICTTSILNQSDTKEKTIWSIGHSSFPVFALETEMYDDAAIGSTTPSLNKNSSVWGSRRFANLSTDEMDGIARLNTPILRVLKSPNQLTFLAIRSSERRKSPECGAHQ